jgi:putative transposase
MNIKALLRLLRKCQPVHFNVTAHPTAEWTAQQMLEAFPFDTAPKYFLRDRDRIYGQEFRDQVEVMNIKEVLSAPRSPWQRAYVERVIGSIPQRMFGSCDCR